MCGHVGDNTWDPFFMPCEACRHDSKAGLVKENNYLCLNRDSTWMCMFGVFSLLDGKGGVKMNFRPSLLLSLDFSRTFTNETHAIESFYQEVECLVLVTICCFCFLTELSETDKKTRIIVKETRRGVANGQ